MAGSASCGHCGEPWSSIPAVESSTLGAGVRRCGRCGQRATTHEPQRFVVTCDRCCRTFLQDRLLDGTAVSCPDCAAGTTADAPEPRISEATHAEIREALDAICSFVTAEPLGQYLDRLARDVAARIEGAPDRPRVVVLDEPSLLTLGLPSGELLVSLGMLRSLDDEAELAFVLAHELVHLAAHPAADRMCQIGFEALGRTESDRLEHAWAEAAFEQARLGFGTRRERQADARAMAVVQSLGYDPRSALRLLERLRQRIDSGDASLASLAAAHPPPMTRIRRLSTALSGAVGGAGIERVNREVFRRAVAAALAPGAMQPSRLVHAEQPAQPGLPAWARILIGAGAAAGLLAIVGWLVHVFSS